MDAAKRSVSEIMQTDIATLAPTDRLDFADDVMQLGRVRHMPVLEDGRLVGIVSNRDLLAASLSKTLDFEPSERRSFLRSIEVSEAMTPAVISVEADATLGEVAQLMLHRKIGCVPVVKPDRTLIGLVTETDLIRATLLSKDDTSSIEVEENIMTDLSAKIEAELKSLQRMRDELRVQMHLAKADAKDLWEQMEHKFGEAESKAKFVARQAQEPLEDVREASLDLLREIRSGYNRIKDAL